MFYGSSTHRKFIFITINWSNNLFLQLERRKKHLRWSVRVECFWCGALDPGAPSKKSSPTKGNGCCSIDCLHISSSVGLQNWVTHESQRQTVIKLIMLIEPCVVFLSRSFSCVCLRRCIERSFLVCLQHCFVNTGSSSVRGKFAKW